MPFDGIECWQPEEPPKRPNTSPKPNVVSFIGIGSDGSKVYDSSFWTGRKSPPTAPEPK